MYHLLASTYYTLGIGLIIGLIFRAGFELSKIEVSLSITDFFGIVWNSEALILIFIITGFIGLILVIRSASRSLITNFEPSFEAIIRHSLRNYPDLENDFKTYVSSSERE